MGLIEVFQSFKTQDQAVEFLEGVRWQGKSICPYCRSEKVCRHASGDRARMRWQCETCHRAFSVTVNTIFHGTHISLRNWFLVLGLMLNTKKSVTAYQIARDLGMRRPTVWSMMHRIRNAMANDNSQRELLYRIVQADKTYVGGELLNRHQRGADGDKRSKSGQGKKEKHVAGERGGRIIATQSGLKTPTSKESA